MNHNRICSCVQLLAIPLLLPAIYILNIIVWLKLIYSYQFIEATVATHAIVL